MKPMIALLIVWSLTCCSCRHAIEPEQTPPAVSDGTSFGIDNHFSGQLSDEQEKRAAEELRWAYYVKSVQDITKAGLARRMAHRGKVLEETRDGVRYVALQDYLCVEFPTGVRGQMIVIERYRITDE